MQGCSMATSDKKLQSFHAFNAGEYSKELAGRTDLESFASSTRYCSNFLSQVSGGLKKFYGTKHIIEKTLEEGFTKIKLIPFINKYEPMALIIYGCDVGYSSAEGSKIGLIYGDNYKDLDLRLANTVNVDELRWKQVGDRLFMVHKSIKPISIDFYGKDKDTNEYIFVGRNVEFTEVPYFPIGSTNDFNIPLVASGLTDTVTMTIPLGYGVGVYFPTKIFDNPVYKRSYYYGHAHDDWVYKIKDSNVVIQRIRNGVTTNLVNGYSCHEPYYDRRDHGSDVDLIDTISHEMILKAVRKVYPSAFINKDMIMLNGITDHQDGDKYRMIVNVGKMYREVDPNDPSTDVEIYPAETLTSIWYTPEQITTVNIDAEAVLGRKMKFFFNDDTEISPWWQGRTVSANDYAYSNGHWYKASNGGTCGNVQPSHTFGVRSDGGVNWKYVHSGSTTGTIIGVPSSNTITVQIEHGQELPNNDNNIMSTYSWSIWGKDGIYPSDIYMIGNRLGFICNTKDYGSWNAMSVTGDYFNFSTEEYGEQLDTSAIVHLVSNNEASDINWVLARKDVYMGGYSGEFHLTSSTATKTAISNYTPTTTRVENISNMGGRSVVPLKYKQLNMFVGMTGKELYTVGYDYTIDDYTPKSLGYLTQHIMDKGIKRIEALNNLDRNIYLLHDTQELSLFNYAADQKVMGFTELNFDAPVIDFCSTYARDEVAAYVVTQRNTGKITIERFMITEPNYMFDEITQGDGTLANFQPVTHFANRTVFIRYGENFSQFTKVELDANGDYSHDPLSGIYVPQSGYFKVGLPMVAEMHTQPAFGDKVDGHQQQSLYMYVRLLNSGAFDYGSSVDFSKYFRHEYWNTKQEWGLAHRLFTGDLKLEIPLGYAEAQNQGEGLYPNTSAVGVNIKSDEPEPLNILSIQEIYR